MSIVEKPSLTIRYRWENDRSGVDLDVLGESIIGFNTVIKELGLVLRIKGDISVKTQIAKDGSIIFEILTNFATSSLHIPFNSIPAYIDFLTLVGKHLVTDGLIMGKQIHEDANVLYARNPLDAALLGYGLVKLIAWAQRQKKNVTLQDDAKKFIPKNYAIRLHRLIRKKRVFKRALRPFIDDQVSSVEITPFYRPGEKAVINNKNFEDYLSEDERILPEYENGEVYKFTGVIVGLESSRGEYMKFKANEIEREYNLLVAFPAKGEKTEDFIEYYKKQVMIEAVVLRESLYKKPKLMVRTIDLVQKRLF